MPAKAGIHSRRPVLMDSGFRGCEEIRKDAFATPSEAAFWISSHALSPECHRTLLGDSGDGESALVREALTIADSPGSQHSHRKMPAAALPKRPNEDKS